MPQKHLQENPEIKKKLRRYGKLSLIIGGLCMLFGFIDFFSPGMPTLFFLFFIGMPLLFVGAVLMSYGYMGEVARYTATQVAPVTKDTINYMVDGTKESVTNLASGIIKEVKGKKEDLKTCNKCQSVIKDHMKFCSSCGERLHKICPSCNHTNAQDAKFCADCGYDLRGV